MSELTLFKSGASLPDYLRSDPDEFTKRLAGGSTGKTISIKGGVWRMIVGGEEIAKNEDRAMNLVVVNAAPAVARTTKVFMKKAQLPALPVSLLTASCQTPRLRPRKVLPALPANRTSQVLGRANLVRAALASVLQWPLRVT